jgi:hypothetical protein
MSFIMFSLIMLSVTAPVTEGYITWFWPLLVIGDDPDNTGLIATFLIRQIVIIVDIIQVNSIPEK